MNISINVDETDLHNGLNKVITGDNKEELVKLFTGLLIENSLGTQLFFKLLLGNKLFEIIPNNTMCKMHVDKLGYGSKKELLKEQFADSDCMIVVTVKKFRGYHEYSHYMVEYTNFDDQNKTYKDTSYVSHEDLHVMEDF